MLYLGLFRSLFDNFHDFVSSVYADFFIIIINVWIDHLQLAVFALQH